MMVAYLEDINLFYLKFKIIQVLLTSILFYKQAVQLFGKFVQAEQFVLQTKYYAYTFKMN